MKQTAIKELEYFCRELKITDGIAKTEGIRVIFERKNKTLYSREYSINFTPFDIPQISKKLENNFIHDILNLYRIFVADECPNIKSETFEEFCKEWIKRFLNETS
jgi:hypothetical protein